MTVIRPIYLGCEPDGKDMRAEADRLGREITARGLSGRRRA